MSGVLQEAGDADSRARTRSLVKLIISTFLTLLHLLYCLICTRNAMSIVLLLQIMGDGIGGGWFIYIKVWVWGQGVGIIL